MDVFIELALLMEEEVWQFAGEKAVNAFVGICCRGFAGSLCDFIKSLNVCTRAVQVTVEIA